MAIIQMMSAHQFFQIISPLFSNLPQNITKMSINLNFASCDPVTVTAEFFSEVTDNGVLISDKLETAVFEVVKKSDIEALRIRLEEQDTRPVSGDAGFKPSSAI